MDDNTDNDAPPPEQKKSGALAIVMALLVVTVIGGAGGAAISLMQVDTISLVATKRAHEAPKADDRALAWDKATTTARLDPVIVNLASPAGARIRLDTAMVFDVDAVGDIERMKAVLSQDILTFLRTVSLGELQGASALGHLRDDLNERVRVASGGAVRELLIETLILQ